MYFGYQFLVKKLDQKCQDDVIGSLVAEFNLTGTERLSP